MRLVTAGDEPRQRLCFRPVVGASTKLGFNAHSFSIKDGSTGVTTDYRVLLHATPDANDAAGGWSSTITLDRVAQIQLKDPAAGADAGDRLGGTSFHLERDSSGALVSARASDAALPIASDMNPLKLMALDQIVPLPVEPVGPGAIWEVRVHRPMMGAEIEETWRVTLLKVAGSRVAVDASFSATTSSATIAVDPALGPLPLRELEYGGEGRMILDLATATSTIDSIWHSVIRVQNPGDGTVSTYRSDIAATSFSVNVDPPVAATFPIACEVATLMLGQCMLFVPKAQNQQVIDSVQAYTQAVADDIAAGATPQALTTKCRSLLATYADVEATCRSKDWK